MQLGASGRNESLWKDALSLADAIEELAGLGEVVPLDFWLHLSDDLDFLMEETEGTRTALEQHLISALVKDTRILLEAARAHQPLPEADWSRWVWTVILACALNGEDLLARDALHKRRRDKPKELAHFLASIDVAEAELPPVIFDKPTGIITMTTPLTEEERQTAIARIFDDDEKYH